MMSLSVAVFNPDTAGYSILFDCIPTFEEADLLAQLAMGEKTPRQLIIILPGWNRGIHKDQKQYALAKELAIKYCSNC